MGDEGAGAAEIRAVIAVEQEGEDGEGS